MKKTMIIGACVLGMLSPIVTNAITHQPYTEKVQVSDAITATISKSTTEKELEDLQDFFAENDIELIIKKIEFNDQKEITGLSIVLKKGNSQSNYTANSNRPIEDLELGYKDNNLFISNSGMFDIASWQNQSNFTHPSFKSLDSIMKNGGLAMDMADFKDQIMNSMSMFENMQDMNGMSSLQDFFNDARGTTKKFQFKNDPNLDKLIIIDGEESDFDTLDQLAKDDQIDSVDFLKSATAISIYGDKAKDGAVIATTKK
ncbi:hypothetical protein NBT05_16885 [Aquimarina sp. ERC-38]|uniref:hypothetical protein n=1 Tax=Aquimarina sp. ERC-38 TaxID=2949996 RepID=UPI002245693A|nr:hypothetical protein [Aquimarina sp. ERC-38]UZO80605.1 hypothetical protein NBT05_16885 [Aquimarina sp. ERC-38]